MAAKLKVTLITEDKSVSMKIQFIMLKRKVTAGLQYAG